VLFRLVRGGRVAQWLMDVNPDGAIAVGYLREGSLVARFLTRLFRFTLHHSDHIIVLDRWMKERILRHGVDLEKMVVIPPWAVQKNGAQPVGERENRFREELGLQGKFVVLYSGNHSVVHPLDTLLGAAELMQKDPAFVFLFIGGGLRVRDVTEFKQQKRLSNILQLPPQPREKLSETLGAADLHAVVMGDAISGLVHTSKIYGVLETGRPYVFIGPRRSHVVDLLNECPFGFHVENGRVDELKSILYKAKSMTDADRARFFRENRAYLQTHFTMEQSLSIFRSELLGKANVRSQLVSEIASSEATTVLRVP
jgi:glycosyltransferase involved in cell wall biosynthesis